MLRTDVRTEAIKESEGASTFELAMGGREHELYVLYEVLATRSLQPTRLGWDSISDKKSQQIQK